MRDLDAGRGWFCRYAVRQAKAAGTAMAERRIREEIDEVIGFMIDILNNSEHRFEYTGAFMIQIERHPG